MSDRLTLRQVIAMGVGAMVGGGIFSVLGLAISQAGHASPLAFALGGIIALLTGYSYTRLGLAFRSDGGSFTYLEHAFRTRNVAGLGGWLLLVGYIDTMALYAYTFRIYGALLRFLWINLTGVKETGTGGLITGAALIFVAINLSAFRLRKVVGIMAWWLSADCCCPCFRGWRCWSICGAISARPSRLSCWLMSYCWWRNCVSASAGAFSEATDSGAA